MEAKEETFEAEAAEVCVLLLFHGVRCREGCMRAILRVVRAEVGNQTFTAACCSFPGRRGPNGHLSA